MVKSSEPKAKDKVRAMVFSAARLKSCSVNVETFCRCKISSNLGCRHVPGDAEGADVGIVGFGLCGPGVEGRALSTSIFIEDARFWTKRPALTKTS